MNDRREKMALATERARKWSVDSSQEEEDIGSLTSPGNSQFGLPRSGEQLDRIEEKLDRLIELLEDSDD